jgi:hypothetical protein
MHTGKSFKYPNSSVSLAISDNNNPYLNVAFIEKYNNSNYSLVLLSKRIKSYAKVHPDKDVKIVGVDYAE